MSLLRKITVPTGVDFNFVAETLFSLSFISLRLVSISSLRNVDYEFQWTNANLMAKWIIASGQPLPGIPVQMFRNTSGMLTPEYSGILRE